MDENPLGRKRLFFENSGGSLRLKACVEAKARYEQIPDCPLRYHDVSLKLHEVKDKGNPGPDGSAFWRCPGRRSPGDGTDPFQGHLQYHPGPLWKMCRGTNVVTTAIEHPSAYDAARMYAEKTGKEFRVARANPETGGVDVEEILKLVDQDTCLLSVMSASNISGKVFPMKEIVEKARQIKPDLFILSDAVQHAPPCSPVRP